ncbi:MAG TPA: hypothetical protein VNZ52_10980 [Candidatus Thermoplasmatota archaeon]|nr:hypothetical protein [Candidatus Thermoplasmatota archaeon]
MGFSVTAANVIIFVGLLAAGSTLAATMLNTADRVSEASSEEWRTEYMKAHTKIRIDLADYFNSGPRRVDIDVTNTGSTVLNASRVTILADGVWYSATVRSVDGDATQRTWPPETQARFRILVSSSPSRITVSTEYGVLAVTSTVV